MRENEINSCLIHTVYEWEVSFWILGAGCALNGMYLTFGAHFLCPLQHISFDRVLKNVDQTLSQMEFVPCGIFLDSMKPTTDVHWMKGEREGERELFWRIPSTQSHCSTTPSAVKLMQRPQLGRTRSSNGPESSSLSLSKISLQRVHVNYLKTTITHRVPKTFSGPIHFKKQAFYAVIKLLRLTVRIKNGDEEVSERDELKNLSVQYSGSLSCCCRVPNMEYWKQ